MRLRLLVVSLVLLSGCISGCIHENERLAALDAARRERAQKKADADIARETPAVEALVAKKRYGEALERQAVLASKSRDGSKARLRWDEIRREAAGYYGDIAAKATTPHRRYLFAELAHAFGGPELAPQWIFDAEGVHTIAWGIDTSHVTCPNAIAYINKAFPPVMPGTAGTHGSLRVELACNSSRRTFETTETFTYFVEETYTEDQIGSRSVPTTVYDPGHLECHQVPHTSYSGSTPTTSYSSECHQTSGTTRTEYRSETTHTPVTRTRQVPRQGTRQVPHVEWTTRTDGRAHVGIEQSLANGNLTQTAVLETETATGSEASAFDAVVVKLKAIVADAADRRAAPTLGKADNAARLGLFDDAEEGYVSAMLETGHLAPSFAAYLESKYGLPSARAPEAVRGALSIKVEPPQRASAPREQPATRR